jgi:RHS repeat-associated protein
MTNQNFSYYAVACQGLDAFYFGEALEKNELQEKKGTDYYPGGSPMPNRSLNLNSYRYSYQGQEKEDLTGQISFELREYDPQLLRFQNPDPYGQFISPYLAMGNNPVNNIDPDGGWTNPIFSPDGVFLGVDDKGYDGEAIIMEIGKFFELGGDGMKHEDAMAFGNSMLLSSLSQSDQDAFMQSPGGEMYQEMRGNMGIFGSLLGELKNQDRFDDMKFEGVLFNPTGTQIREQDGHGDGHYGAPRGSRKHKGIDLVTTVGQDIISPTDGKARNFVGSTSGKPMIDIFPSDKSLNIQQIRMLYVNMPSNRKAYQKYDVQRGKTVVGTAASMVDLGYSSGMTPHVHIQVKQNNKWVNPTSFFFGNQ